MNPLHRRLSTTLAELHKELAQADTSDPAIRDLLHDAADEIQGVLESQPPREREESLRSRLQKAAIHFEETHPTLSATITNLVDTLSQMGI